MQQLSDSAAQSKNNSDNAMTPDEEPRFKKMKPRVGSQYQIKVPKAPSYHLGGCSTYESDRPAPNKLSTEYTHLTLEEVETAKQLHHDDDSNSEWYYILVTLSPFLQAVDVHSDSGVQLKQFMFSFSQVVTVESYLGVLSGLLF